MTTMYMKDYSGNALDITDEQVAADWRLGLLRSVARVMQYSIVPEDSTGRFGIVVPGSNREHVRGPMHTNRGCAIVEIYDVKEEGGEEYNFSTFGGDTRNVLVLKGKATCACGKLIAYPMSMQIAPDELIYTVMNVDA